MPPIDTGGDPRVEVRQRGAEERACVADAGRSLPAAACPIVDARDVTSPSANAPCGGIGLSTAC